MSPNRNISDDEFRYVSNLKNKPNAQGTLFQVNSSQRKPEARQPRGYSPQRYSEVAEAVGAMRKSYGPQTYGGHEHGGTAYQIYKGHAGTLAKAVSAIARSTIPLSDIKKPKPDEPKTLNNPELHVGVVPQSDRTSKTLGVYNSSPLVANKDYAAIHLTSGEPTPKGQKKKARDKEADATVLHEIGHHVDWISKIGGSRGTGSFKDSGHGEGFADQYAENHARTPGYKQRKVKVDYKPSRWTDLDKDTQYPGATDYAAQYLFKEGYNQGRHGTPYDKLQPAQFGEPGDKKTYPKGHVKGQLPLIQKDWHNGRENEPYWRLSGPADWD